VAARLLVAAALAAAVAVVFAVPAIWGVATWKWVLGVVGAWLFVTAGRRGK
jgi:hypothetical protein